MGGGGGWRWKKGALKVVSKIQSRSFRGEKIGIGVIVQAGNVHCYKVGMNFKFFLSGLLPAYSLRSTVQPLSFLVSRIGHYRL